MNQLKGTPGTALSELKGLSGTDNFGLKGGGFDTGTQLKSPPASPSGDSRVVNVQNLPSGLTKGLDAAIAGAYADAPPGVSDRVRKGFQAVMARDWKLAKAWFEDALNRDPGNPGLKRLIVLADYKFDSRQGAAPPAKSPAPVVQSSTSDKAEFDKFLAEFKFGRQQHPPDKVRKYVSSLSNEEFKHLLGGLQATDSEAELLFILDLMTPKPGTTK